MDFSQQQRQYQDLQAQMAQLGTLINAQQPQKPAQYAQQIEYVDGLEGARAYLKEKAGPNGSAVVFSSSEDKFFTLSKDANGTPAKIKRG